jgi:hypothetical protein
MGRKNIRRHSAARAVPAKGFSLADEIQYIQARAAVRDGRLVVINHQVAFFSTDTGDAWLLDPIDHLAARLARDGLPEAIFYEETATQFGIAWKGTYRIEGDAFLYTDSNSGRVITILGYPTEKIAQLSPAAT